MHSQLWNSKIGDSEPFMVRLFYQELSMGQR